MWSNNVINVDWCDKQTTQRINCLMDEGLVVQRGSMRFLSVY